MHRKIALLVSSLALALLLGSCDLLGLGKPDEDTTTVNITSVGWQVETIHQDFWSNPDDNFPTVNISFWIYCEKTFDAAKVESVRVILPGGASSWTLDKSEFNPDYSATRSRFGSWQRFIWSSSHNSMPIGFMTAEVKLVNGASDTHTFEVSRPGSLSSDGFDYVTIQDPVPNPSTYDKALAMPTISSPNLDTTNRTVSLGISSTDTRIVNGCVEFYDASGEYLGWSGWARDSISGDYTPALNSGANVIYTNGTTNSLVIPEAYLLIADGSFDSIASCHVILTDGQHYEGEGQYNWWDYCVISELVQFP